MQTLVIGAGVVGLAIARAAALAGHDVIVAEQGPRIGEGISSRNSEVIHAGMYYTSGTLRAAMCPPGNRALLAFCSERNIPHRKCGKLIVAANEAEMARVEAIFAQGQRNGVEHLRLIEQQDAKALEPELRCVGALLSPETGIVDSHSLMLTFQGDIESCGGAIVFLTPVERITRNSQAWTVAFGGVEPVELDFDVVINSAGLGAQAIAAACEGYPAHRVPALVLAKGNYFKYTNRAAFSHLIYPTPVDGGLGIHATLDLGGGMRFGPDVEWIDAENFEVDAKRADSFYEQIRTYWPRLESRTLVPDYAGIRPKLSGPGQPAADFLIDGPADHGLPGLVHLFGIESPGLTCALPIASEVMRRLDMAQ
ncbi:NAD(P)/FAD-dependent oxidoreductase (plasmid) [Mesorhizobium sp. ORM8.1]